MRGLTSTIILLLVLGGLVGYIYFVDAPPAGEADAKPKAFTVSAENIEEVQIRNLDGETSRAQRIDTTWQVVEPVKADADAAEVAAITSGLAGLEVQRVIDENPSDVKQYGLEPARVEVAFREKDQKEFRRLLIGEKTPAGTDLYAKTPDQNRVFLISSFLESTFNKNAFNLRDKTVLKFDREKADTVEIGGASPVQFTREGTEWRIVKPIAARADYAAVEGLVTKLSSGQMQEIVASEASASDLKQYGLVSPATRVDVGTGSARATLLVGTPNPEGLPFAKDAARPAVFTIDKALMTDLSRPVDEFRRKDVFDFRSFTANRVELRRDSTTQTFEKTNADGKEVWRSGGKDVDSANVEALLTALTNLRAQSFERAAPPALEMPVLTAVVQFDEGRKTETVTFGRAGTDTFAARADEPGAARLESGTFDEAIKALDALK